MPANAKKAQRERNELARAEWDDEGGAIRSEPDEQPALGDAEQRILQRLGAAVIAQWNDLPTEIQRRLFQHAVSVGEPHPIALLKEEIARFLHDHKNGVKEVHIAR